MYKKILSVMLAVLLILSFNFSSVSAATNSEELTEEEKYELIHMGKHTVDEQNGAHIFELERNYNNSTRSIESEEKIIEKTVYIICPVADGVEDELSQMINQTRAGGNNNIYDSDSSGAIEAYSKVYYQYQTKNGKEYVYMTSIKGGFTGAGSGSIISSGVTIDGQEVTYGQSGFQQAVIKRRIKQKQ